MTRFPRVLGLLDPGELTTGLFQWTRALQAATGGKLIAIDGKSLRRSFRKKSGWDQLHLVTAWTSDNGLTLGQVACADKSNEITAIPQLLKLLNLEGCPVTIDAMGCQTEIAAQIRDRKAHYLLALNGNQSGFAGRHAALVRARRGDQFLRNETCRASNHGDGTRSVRRACLSRGGDSPRPSPPARSPYAGRHGLTARRERSGTLGIATVHQQPSAPRPTTGRGGAKALGHRERTALGVGRHVR
ncbi:MAG: ISAs1 family transposase [Planctomycetales bacterium]|nr:ISAs1 family transposase [Planctomycetales bacterium]